VALTPARTTPHSHSREQVVIGQPGEVVTSQPGAGRDRSREQPKAGMAKINSEPEADHEGSVLCDQHRHALHDHSQRGRLADHADIVEDHHNG
jgi:hypothetical protein